MKQALSILLAQTSDAVEDINKCFREHPLPSYLEVQRTVRCENFFSAIHRQKALRREYIVQAAQITVLLSRMRRVVEGLKEKRPAGELDDVLLYILACSTALVKVLQEPPLYSNVLLEKELKDRYLENSNLQDALADVAVKLAGTYDAVEVYMKK